MQLVNGMRFFFKDVGNEEVVDEKKNNKRRDNQQLRNCGLRNDKGKKELLMTMVNNVSLLYNVVERFFCFFIL